jgi:hypothetical protein
MILEEQHLSSKKIHSFLKKSFAISCRRQSKAVPMHIMKACGMVDV